MTLCNTPHPLSPVGRISLHHFLDNKEKDLIEMVWRDPTMRFSKLHCSAFAFLLLLLRTWSRGIYPYGVIHRYIQNITVHRQRGIVPRTMGRVPRSPHDHLLRYDNTQERRA